MSNAVDQAGQGDAKALMNVIIAARNEEAYIGACLEALLGQSDAAGPVETILAANACTDRTVEVASAYSSRFDARGWTLTITDVPEPGKVNALNAADRLATGQALVFLDADVRLDPDLLAQLRKVLCVDKPLYATGRLQVAPARSWVTRRYARFWVELPFVKGGTVGAGLFAVNRAGRERWSAVSDNYFGRHICPASIRPRRAGRGACALSLADDRRLPQPCPRAATAG